MLDRELIKLARRATRVGIQDRQQRFLLDVEVIQNTMTARGVGIGAIVGALERRGAKEIRAWARLSYRELRRVIQAAQVSYEEDLARLMKTEVEAVLRDEALQITAVVANRAGLLSNHAREAMAEARIQTREVVDVAIDRFVLRLRRESARAGAPSDDELIRELRSSGLPEAQSIIAKIQSSAEALRENPPGLNPCLADARIALETLGKAVARSVLAPDLFSGEKWREAITHLRVEAGCITKGVEAGLTGVYTFVSEGVHVPLGSSELEMVTLGRRLLISMCYFLVRVYKGTPGRADARMRQADGP